MIQTELNHAGQETDPYLRHFARLERESGPSWILPIRKAGLARFAELGFPTTHLEEWRFTNVNPIARLPFRPALEPESASVDQEASAKTLWAELPAHRIVFLNGHFCAELSSEPAVEGLRVESLKSVLANEPEFIEPHLARYARGDDNAFVALNTAFFADGAVIWAAPGLQLDRPVHLIYLSSATDSGQTAHLRNLVMAERGSGLTILESYAGLGGTPYLTNAVTESVVGEGAVVEQVKFQDESARSFHVSALHAELAARAHFVFHSFAVGSQIARNNIKTVLGGEGIECVLNGLYLAKGEQLLDHFMMVEHAEPHCNSHEYFNGILEDRSRGVFHGRILVRPNAQKTDAKQTNKNLLLSENATIDTKPQLEIYADDVKCTHGATVGQLDEESIFYLRARGIGLERARRMLIHSFAGEIIGRIRHPAARRQLDQLVWDRLDENPHLLCSTT